MYVIRWAGPGFYSRNTIGIYEIQEPGWCDPNAPARWFDCVPMGWGVVGSR